MARGPNSHRFANGHALYHLATNMIADFALPPLGYVAGRTLGAEHDDEDCNREHADPGEPEQHKQQQSELQATNK